MFKKIVSNLPFSPALIGQLGIYAKKIRKEKAVRRLTLAFVVLVLIVQAFIILQPPTPTDASSSSSSLQCVSTANSSCNVTKSETAVNTSQGFIDASKVIAKAGDQISYTITVRNPGSASISTALEDNLSDLIEYSTVIDNGGGTLNPTTGFLAWPNIQLNGGETQTRTFAIRLLDSIPSNAQGVNNTRSYDCIIANNFGDFININVDCPAPKIVEKITKELPKAGLIENLVFAFIILAASAYLSARSSQLEKETRIIRQNTNAGTI